MSATFNDIIKNACRQSLEDDLKEYAGLDFNSFITCSLSPKEIHRLADKIMALPTEYKHILFFQYCFNFTAPETEDMLEVENAIGKARYARAMLSDFMGIDDGIIDDQSMRQSCQIALERYTEFDNSDNVRPNYSYKFRRKLKSIKAAQKTTSVIMLIAKRAAVFLLVSAISLSTALVASAELRQIVFDWIVETFPKFSIFSSQMPDITQDDVSLTDFKLGYIPEGFILSGTSEMHSMIVYEYLDGDGKSISVIIAKIAKFHKDTEDAVINKVVFKEKEAYWWQNDNFVHFIWQQDGFSCDITGQLSYEQVVKIAENITK